jgi:hypothetical protein
LTALPLVLATAAAAMTVDGGFVYDDASAIVGNPVVRGTVGAGDAFTRDFWGNTFGEGINTYRPLLPLAWRACWAIGEGSPLPFRLLSVLGHLLATLALAFAVTASGASRSETAAAASIFALHGVTAESVSALIGHADLVSAALGLYAVGIAMRRQDARGASHVALLVLLACLAKESAIVFGIAASAVLHSKRTSTRWAALPSALVVVALVAFHLSLPRSAITTTWNNSLTYDAEGLERMLLGLHNVARGVGLSFVPVALAPNHGFAAVELRAETLWPTAVLGAPLLVLGCAALVMSWRRRNAPSTAVTMVLFGPSLLSSGLFFPVMTDLAERLLYPSAAAASVLLMLAVRRYVRTERRRPIAWAIVAILLLLPSIELRRAWRSDDTLWAYAVSVEPRSVRHQFNYANALTRAGREDEAAWHRMIAIYLVNGYPDGVRWERVAALDERPASRAWLEGPGALYDDPCPMVFGFLRQVREPSPAFFDRALGSLQVRYPTCFTRPPGAE